MIFKESGLEFRFNGDWALRKYDAHFYYKGLSGRGFKGVDFVGVYQGKEVVLFEVKNFKQGRAYGESDFQTRMEEDLPLFIERMSQKVEDSLLVIDAIGQYFERKLWYRLFVPLIRRLNYFNNKWVFWTKVYEQSNTKEDCTFVLWLETENDTPELRKKVQEMLSESLRESVADVLVASCKAPVFDESLAARFMER